MGCQGSCDLYLEPAFLSGGGDATGVSVPLFLCLDIGLALELAQGH